MFQVLLNRRPPSSALCRGIMWPPPYLCRAAGDGRLYIRYCAVRRQGRAQRVMFTGCNVPPPPPPPPSLAPTPLCVFVFRDRTPRLRKRGSANIKKKKALNIHLFSARVKSETTKLCVFPDNGGGVAPASGLLQFKEPRRPPRCIVLGSRWGVLEGMRRGSGEIRFLR